MSTPTETTAQPKADDPKKQGAGAGARRRRNDRRRAVQNTGKAEAIQVDVANQLGLNETSSLAKLTPAFSTRPTGVYISLYGFNEAIKEMLIRMRTIAQRPLALQITDANIATYRKVMLLYRHHAHSRSAD